MSKRPNILKLASKISLESLTYTGISYTDPEYRILAPIVDDDMCDVMMHMRLEASRSVEDIAKRCKKEIPFVQEQLDKLCKAGIVRMREVDGIMCYYYPIFRANSNYAVAKGVTGFVPKSNFVVDFSYIQVPAK